MDTENKIQSIKYSISLILLLSFGSCATLWPYRSGQNTIYLESNTPIEKWEIYEGGKILGPIGRHSWKLDETKDVGRKSSFLIHRCGEISEVPIERKINPILLANFAAGLWSPAFFATDYYTGNFFVRGGLYKFETDCKDSENQAVYRFEPAPRNGNVERIWSGVFGILAFSAFMLGFAGECFASEGHATQRSCEQRRFYLLSASIPLGAYAISLGFSASKQDKLEQIWIEERFRTMDQKTSIEAKVNFPF